jgi:DNA-binding transcriptional LysR family regulator
MQSFGNLRWDELHLVLALLRSGSLKSAATELKVNVSTVSRRLDAMEEALGQVLFDRTPDGTRPTEAATLMAPFAEEMEQAAARAALAVQGLEAEPEGLVRITAPPGVADHFIATALPKLFKRYPKLRIELLSTVSYADLSRREADLALRAMRPSTGDLVSARLGVAKRVVCVAPKLARKLGCVDDFKALPWITYAEDLNHLPEVEWVLKQVPAEQIMLRSNSITAQLEAVRAGAGVRLEASPFVELPGLTELSLSDRLSRVLAQVPSGALYLVGHRALRAVPRISAVWQFLQEHFQGTLSQE